MAWLTNPKWISTKNMGKKKRYKKLKMENKILLEGIHTLVFRPQSADALIIKKKYMFLRDIEEAVMKGDITKPPA